MAVNKNGTYRGKQNRKGFSSVVKLPALIGLSGPWEIRFVQNGYALPRDTMKTLIPLNESTDERIRYFSGKAEYHHRFNRKGDYIKPNRLVLLQLNKVREIAEVFLNGNELVCRGIHQMNLI